MSRNLKARIEVITPVEEPAARARLWEILQIQRLDQRQGWDLQADGAYVQRHPRENAVGDETLGTHALMMQAHAETRPRRCAVES